MKSFKIITLLVLSTLAFSVSASPSVIEVKMMTQAPDGKALVFDPMFVKANVGDTIKFEPMQKAGHTSVSLFVPNGITPWHGKPDTEMVVKLDKEGVYLVECDVHKMMGMVAVVQVGNPTNLEEAKKVAAKESAKMMMNKDRFSKLLDQVK